ncbi:lipopolysaccharide-induced tumor necrosis factor-alpha factor homolog [Megalops cyprinoides]|uniref:lipopolysaccharide-induced tumor necrosis factor-alpha factor homolog n=1 Tax=Megalops cyprinoides TaxID=118141 RepID=UPI001863A468|nr:lipopolysaccharide-induced tumor necrosis factor-alpha factor homolog [Megalops cyprinoides]
MASAPPLETAVPVGTSPPPSYEEAMSQPYPQYLQGPVPPPPGYTKDTQQPHLPQACGPPITIPPATNQPAISVQTVVVQSALVFKDQPVQAHCPVCLQMVMTRIEHHSGTLAWLTCAGLFIFGCSYGCCLIPFCVDGLKDVTHYCPNCNNVLGVYNRL